jgi:hypothetical protein
MKLVKLVAASVLSAAVLLAIGGCSSPPDDKTPKAAGPVDPKLKPVGRDAGDGGPKGGGVQTKGSLEKP